jgi:hypothetical protein
MDLEFEPSIEVIENEFNWLSAFISFRFVDYFQQEKEAQKPTAPDLSQDKSYYSNVLSEFDYDETARMLILIALVPHVKPNVLDVFFTKNESLDRIFTEFGGIKGEKFSGFVPTAETAAFIIAGASLENRIKLQRCLDESHDLYKKNILTLGQTVGNEPIWSGELVISKEFLTNVTLNQQYEPRYSPSFPAQVIDTKLDWSSVHFERNVLKEIEHLNAWIKHELDIRSQFKTDKYLKKGYRVLFYGPPGTGKSMTAALIGKSNKMKVYRIDLSSVVSKYIGETEKNLSRLFDLAENKNWILFFDEADSLFAKRVATQSSNDMHANQKVAYLLQRIEDFNGVVVLATNFKDNIDDAFLRRFQSIIYFPKPSSELRLELWKMYFSSFDYELEDLEEVAENYEISGGSMINVLRYCTVEAIQRGDNKLNKIDLFTSLKKELSKEGVTLK